MNGLTLIGTQRHIAILGENGVTVGGFIIHRTDTLIDGYVSTCSDTVIVADNNTVNLHLISSRELVVIALDTADRDRALLGIKRVGGTEHAAAAHGNVTTTGSDGVGVFIVAVIGICRDTVDADVIISIQLIILTGKSTLNVDVTGISISHNGLGGSSQFLRSSRCGIKHRTVSCVIGVAPRLIGIDDRVIGIHVLQHSEGSDTVRHLRDGTGCLCHTVLIGKRVLCHGLPHDKSCALSGFLIAEVALSVYQRHRDAHQIGFLSRSQHCGIRGSHTIGDRRTVSLGEVGQSLIRLGDDITGLERLTGSNGHRLQSRTVPALHRCLSGSGGVRHHLVVIGGRNRLRGCTFRIVVGNLHTVQRGLDGGLTKGSHIRSPRLGSIRDEIQLHMSIHGIRGGDGSALLRCHRIKCHRATVQAQAQVAAVIQFGCDKLTAYHIDDTMHLSVNSGCNVCDVGLLCAVTHKTDSTFIIHPQVTHMTVTLDRDLRSVLIVTQIGLFTLTANLSVGEVSILLKGHLGTGNSSIFLINIDMQRIDESLTGGGELGILCHGNLVKVVVSIRHICCVNNISALGSISNLTDAVGLHDGTALDCHCGSSGLRPVTAGILHVRVTHLQQVTQRSGGFTLCIVDAVQRQRVTILEHGLGGHSHLSVGDGCLLVIDIIQHQAVCRDGGIAGVSTFLVTVQSQLTVGVDINATIHGQVHITFHRGQSITVNIQTGSHAVTIRIGDSDIRAGNIGAVDDVAVIRCGQRALIERAVSSHGIHRGTIHGKSTVFRAHIGTKHRGSTGDGHITLHRRHHRGLYQRSSLNADISRTFTDNVGIHHLGGRNADIAGTCRHIAAVNQSLGNSNVTGTCRNGGIHHCVGGCPALCGSIIGRSNVTCGYDGIPISNTGVIRLGGATGIFCQSHTERECRTIFVVELNCVLSTGINCDRLSKGEHSHIPGSSRQNRHLTGSNGNAAFQQFYLYSTTCIVLPATGVRLHNRDAVKRGGSGRHTYSTQRTNGNPRCTCLSIIRRRRKIGSIRSPGNRGICTCQSYISRTGGDSRSGDR